MAWGVLVLSSSVGEYQVWKREVKGSGSGSVTVLRRQKKSHAVAVACLDWLPTLARTPILYYRNLCLIGRFSQDFSISCDFASNKTLKNKFGSFIGRKHVYLHLNDGPIPQINTPSPRNGRRLVL